MTHNIPDLIKALEFDNLLSSGAVMDTLIALIERGPLEDGDVPSKNGRDTLIARGFAQRVVVKRQDGFTAATIKGAALYRYAFGNGDTLKQAAERRVAERVISSVRTLTLKPANESAHAECVHCTNVHQCKMLRGCAYHHDVNLWG